MYSSKDCFQDGTHQKLPDVVMREAICERVRDEGGPRISIQLVISGETTIYVYLLEMNFEDL